MAEASADAAGSAGAAVSSVPDAPPSASGPTPLADPFAGAGGVGPIFAEDPDDAERSDDPSLADRLRTIRSDAPPPSRGRSGRGTPTEAELARFMGDKALRWLMLGYVYWLTAPLDMSNDEKAKLIATPDERARMVHPLARLVANTDLNARYGRAVLDSDDIFDSVITLALWIDSTRPLLRERAQTVREQRQMTMVRPVPMPTRRDDESEPEGPSGGGAAQGPGRGPIFPGGLILGGAGA